MYLSETSFRDRETVVSHYGEIALFLFLKRSRVFLLSAPRGGAIAWRQTEKNVMCGIWVLVRVTEDRRQCYEEISKIHI